MASKYCLKGFVSGAPGKWAKATAEATIQQAQPINTEKPVTITALSQICQCHSILQGGGSLGTNVMSLMIKQGEDKALSSASVHITTGLLPRVLLVTP